MNVKNGAHVEYHRLEDLELKLVSNMLSTQYRLRLEFICKKIANKEEVQLDDMIWAEKLAKRHTTARDWLNKNAVKMPLKIFKRGPLMIL